MATHRINSPSYQSPGTHQYPNSPVHDQTSHNQFNETTFTRGNQLSPGHQTNPNVIRWSSTERGASITPSEGFQIEPVGMRYQTDAQGRVFSEHGHKMVVDGDAYTLVIVDCAPQDSGEFRSGSSHSCDCHTRCYCQTELIVRQQVVPHDHVCQHNCTSQQQQRLAIAPPSNRSSSQESQSRTTITQQQQHSEHENYLRRINEHQRQQQDQEQRILQQQQQQQNQHYQQQNNLDQFQNFSPTGDSQRQQQFWRQDREETTTVTHQHSNQLQQQPTHSPTPSSPQTQQQQPQAQQHQQPQPQQQRSPLVPKPGNRIVKRWNWNQQQFVETEVPDRPVTKPTPAQMLPSTSGSQSRPTDVWNQELMAAASTIIESPVPPRHYDPSWLAYRVPDTESVQSDPLYRDLMMELQRLEEGVAASRIVETPVMTPETYQKPVFGQRIMPESIEVKEYENAEFVCRIIPNSDPSMRIEWSVNGRPLLESSRYTNEFDFGIARLRIKRCEAEDSGIYQCKAINALGEAVSTATLRVHAKGNIQYDTLNPAGLEQIRQLENPKQVDRVEEQPVEQPPKFLTHISDYLEKKEGDSVHFECCLAPVDDPDLKTEWFFNGRPLVTGSRFHTIDDFGFIVLDIDWLFPRDTGEYVCRATNKHGTDFTRTVLRVLPDKNIVLDSQLENPTMTIDKLRQLEFPDVEQEVLVEEPDKPAHFVQHLRSKNNKQQFNEGDNVHFEARVGPATDGNLTVEWYHNDKPLINGHRFKPTFDFGHILLDILYVYPEDSGVYKCVARNAAGTDVSQFEIHVTGKQSIVYQSQLPKEMIGGVQKMADMEAMWNRPPDPEEDEAPAVRVAPEFVLKPKPCTAFEGSCARFCCRLTGHPRPRVTWAVNGQNVVSGSRYKLTYDGMFHLIIPKCLLTDAGKIEVHARNLLGECYSATELKVKRKVDDYRGVLKNSPNPWYDEQTLKLYRRQRSMDMTDNDDDDNYFASQSQRLQQLAEQQTLSPIGNQVIGYMEPGTPDVNLLARTKSPLVEPGDLHPVVVEQQVVMAPAPSTIQRALNTKDSIRSPERSFQLTSDVTSKRRDHQQSDQQQQLQQVDNNDLSQASGASKQQQQHRIFGLNLPRPPAKTLNNAAGSSDQEGNMRGQDQRRQRQQDQQQTTATTTTTTSSFDPRLPPPSPESSVHGREIHSQTHKQTQLERRANKEIVREIIEKETFEQEHKGVTKDNMVRGTSSERGFTPTETLQSRQDELARRQLRQFGSISSSGSGQAHNQQQMVVEEQQVLVEDYMTPPEFVQKIQPCQAVDGDEARFECSFIGDPTPTISWYRESKMIKASNMYQIMTDLKENKSTLIIKRVSLNGNAVYTVKAENVAGSAKSSANLVVEPHPLPGQSRGGVARQMEGGIAATSSTSTTTTTTVETKEAHGSSSGQLSTVGKSISASSKQQLQQQQQADDKVVKSVRTRRLSPDELASLIRASPEGLVAPTFLHTIHDITGRLGELVRLDARLVGTHPMEVRWLKDNQRIRADQGHKLLLEGDLYTYLILECARTDAGFYECVASNRVGEARCGATLNISDGRQSVASDRLGTPEMVGSSSGGLLVQQHSRSVSPATFDHQLNASGERKHFGLTKHQFNPLMGQFTLTESGLQRMDQIPKLIKRLESQQVREGKSVTLRCQISSYPPAEVYWYKLEGNKLIKPSKYFRIFKDNDETYCLKILETFAEDQGEYRCMAKAPNGYVETTATITVIPNSPR